MRNMSYCRFQNALRLLLDCQDHLEDYHNGALSLDEAHAAKALIEVCKMIVEDYEE